MPDLHVNHLANYLVLVTNSSMLTELLDFTGILKMLSAAVMVMTTMATACVLSFLEVEGEAVVEVVVAVEWDPQGQGMVPPPDAPTTGLL